MMFDDWKKTMVRNKDCQKASLAVFLTCLIVGILAGLSIFVFRTSLDFADSFRSSLFAALRSGRVFTILLVIPVFLSIGLFVGFLCSRRPTIAGSGITQIKYALNKGYFLGFLPELPNKMVGCVLGNALGLSLGRGGPSLQIGAFVGSGAWRFSQASADYRNCFLLSGAAAGFAAVFNAPLAGIFFIFEELHRSISIFQLLCVASASLAGYFVSGAFFGFKPLFAFQTAVPIPFRMLIFAVILGAICALAGELFKKGLKGVLGLYNGLGISSEFRPALALVVSIPFGLFLFEATGGGFHLIAGMESSRASVGSALLLLAGKYALTAISFGSGAPGGLFFPLLACGALIGDILSAVFSSFSPILGGFETNYILIGMSAFFTAVFRTPAAGIVLVLEMSGNLDLAPGIVSGCLAAYITGSLMKSKDMFDLSAEP